MIYVVPEFNQVNFDLEAYTVPTFNLVDFEIGDEGANSNIPKASIALTTYPVTTSILEAVRVYLPTAELVLTTYPVVTEIIPAASANLPLAEIAITTYPVSTSLSDNKRSFLPLAELTLTMYAIKSGGQAPKVTNIPKATDIEITTYGVECFIADYRDKFSFLPIKRMYLTRRIVTTQLSDNKRSFLPLKQIKLTKFDVTTAIKIYIDKVTDIPLAEMTFDKFAITSSIVQLGTRIRFNSNNDCYDFFIRSVKVATLDDGGNLRLKGVVYEEV
jgi:hypothetical protein